MLRSLQDICEEEHVMLEEPSEDGLILFVLILAYDRLLLRASPRVKNYVPSHREPKPPSAMRVG